VLLAFKFMQNHCDSYHKKIGLQKPIFFAFEDSFLASKRYLSQKKIGFLKFATKGSSGQPKSWLQKKVV
jgi:hypothetical protein